MKKSSTYFKLKGVGSCRLIKREDRIFRLFPRSI